MKWVQDNWKVITYVLGVVFALGGAASELRSLRREFTGLTKAVEQNTKAINRYGIHLADAIGSLDGRVTALEREHWPGWAPLPRGDVWGLGDEGGGGVGSEDVD